MNDFSTIRPMSTATISRMPAYTSESAAPAASSPIITTPKKKKSHWFLKTVAGAAILAGAAALLRGKVDLFKNFDVKAVLPDSATLLEKAKHYGTKAVAVVGDFVTEKSMLAYNWVKNLITKKP